MAHSRVAHSEKPHCGAPSGAGTQPLAPHRARSAACAEEVEGSHSSRCRWSSQGYIQAAGYAPVYIYIMGPTRTGMPPAEPPKASDAHEPPSLPFPAQRAAGAAV